MATGSFGTVAVVDSFLPAGFPSGIHLSQSTFQITAPTTWSGVTLSKKPYAYAQISFYDANDYYYGSSYARYYLTATSGSAVNIVFNLPVPASVLSDGIAYKLEITCQLLDSESDPIVLAEYTSEESFTYYEYSNPVVSAFSVKRCLIDGTVKDEGEYVLATIAYSVTSIANNNTKTLKVYRRVSGTSDWTLDSEISIASLGYSDTCESVQLTLVYSSTSAFDLKAEITDSILTSSNIKTLSVSVTTIDFDVVNHKIAFGKRVEPTGPSFDVNLDARFRGPVTLDGGALDADGNQIGYEVYSTSRRIVGKWIDGKTIYRKVLDIGAISASATKNISLGETAVDMCIRIWGTSWGSGANPNFDPIPSVSTSTAYMLCAYLVSPTTNPVIALKSGTGCTRAGGYVVVDYTLPD